MVESTVQPVISGLASQGVYPFLKAPQIDQMGKSPSCLEIGSPGKQRALLEERQIKILDNTSVQGGIYSYGNPIGIIASVVIAILVILHLIPPFHSLVSRVTDRVCCSHREEINETRDKLAENRLQALQKALPKAWPTDYREMLNGIFGNTDRETLRKAGYSIHEISEEIQRLIPHFQGESYRHEINSEDEEVNRALLQIKAKTPHAFLQEARKIPGIEAQVALLSLALIHCEGERIAKQYEEARNSLTPPLQTALENLVPQALEARQLEYFLVSKKFMGKELFDPKFQDGLTYLAFHVKFKRDNEFLSHLEAIQKAIQSPPKSNLEPFLQKEVRERLDQMIQSSVYRDLVNRHGSDHPIVAFVQDLTLALRIDSQGMEELGELGALYHSKVKEERGELPQTGQCTFLADAMDDTIKKHHTSYKIESLFDKLYVLARYPEKTMMAYISHQPESALEYNSYKIGNHDLAYGDFRYGEAQMHALLGPTPTGDATIIAQLDSMQERGGIHLQHNLEHPGFSMGDLTRTKYLIELEKQYPDTFRLFSTPLDGTAWKLKGKAGDYFKDYKTTRDFFLKFGTFAFTNRLENPACSFDQLHGEAHRRMEGEKDNGFYIGKDVMSDKQLRLAFECASEAFSGINPEHEKKKRLTRALEVGVEGFIAVGAIVKTLGDLPPEEAQEKLMQATFGQACKLDIDRGIVMNVMTRVYFHLLSGEKLNDQTINEIIGIVIGRAEIVSGRTIIADRYQPLSDALRLIGKDELRVKNALRNYLHRAFGVNIPACLTFQSSS